MKTGISQLVKGKGSFNAQTLAIFENECPMKIVPNKKINVKQMLAELAKENEK